VSIGGGESPAWHPGGTELFFIGPDASGKRAMKVAAFEAAPRVHIGTAKTLFDFAPTELKFFCGTIRCYDVSPDGQRFFLMRSPARAVQPLATHINLVQDWLEELKAGVPAR
jgi:hypothetical protein